MITRKARVDQVDKLEGEEMWTSIMYILNDPSVVALRKQVVDAGVLLKHPASELRREPSRRCNRPRPV
jgi:hypothetical protein